ncbi:MAG: glycoside hydrolase family 3 C-terminal domain-containing protein [Mycobacterium sp.]
MSNPDPRACEVEQQLNDDERFSLIVSVMGASEMLPIRDPRIPEGVPMSTGYVAGVPRLGIPALMMSDASLGVANLGYRPGDTATALPSSLAIGASFNRDLARAAGAAIGAEARSRGFNVMLAGGVNLCRDPRNGRNFEYISEDPLLSGDLAAASVNGIQSRGVISTLKHFSLNCNETNRHWLNAIIDPAAHRESDLLAFEIAIERSHPGAVMSGYHKVNGEPAGGNATLLEDVLKGVWGYPGWVMSDWGATPSWEFALKGLDQESGAQIDGMLWGTEAFTDPLKAALADGTFPAERLSDMVRRILRSMFAVGVDRWGPAPEVDMAAHHRVALEIARQGIVVLKNDGILPLSTGSDARVAVIGGHAATGVPTGCGSSTVVPPGGYAEVVRIGGPGLMAFGRNLYLLPSAPVAELAKQLSRPIEFDPAMFPAEAAVTAASADVAIVFAIRVESEGYDNPDLSLPWGQDAVIEAVAAANPNTIVVLETGNPVVMPWLDDVKAVAQAWFPGQAGGQAIAEVLAGRVNPSGRLHLTFPVGVHQTPRPDLPGVGVPWGTPTTITYDEGAEVGYRWFAATGREPLFAFGHGLSYTTFEHRDFELVGGDTVTATVTVHNTGSRDGADVVQLYLVYAPDGKRRRLLGFERVDLPAGESRRVTFGADPRLLARYDGGRWRIAGGNYTVAVGESAAEFTMQGVVELTGRTFCC